MAEGCDVDARREVEEAVAIDVRQGHTGTTCEGDRHEASLTREPRCVPREALVELDGPRAWNVGNHVRRPDRATLEGHSAASTRSRDSARWSPTPISIRG